MQPVKEPVIRGAPPPQKKSLFFGDFSQMWVGGVADSQRRSKLLKKKITPKIVFFDLNFTFRFPTQPPKGFCEIWENER